MTCSNSPAPIAQEIISEIISLLAAGRLPPFPEEIISEIISGFAAHSLAAKCDISMA